MKGKKKRLLNLRLLNDMYRFYDVFGTELEKRLLGSVGFPYYLALACVLIDKICNEHYNDINLRYL